MTSPDPTLYPESVANAENAIVALGLVDPGKALATNLDSTHFFNPVAGHIWDAIQTTYNEGKQVDPFAIVEYLTRKGLSDAIGGYSGISNFLLKYFVTGMADRYAEVIREGWQVREIRRLVSEIPAVLNQGATPQEIGDRLRAFVDRLDADPSAEAKTLDVEIAEEFVRIAADVERISKGEAPETGLPSGLGVEDVSPVGIPKDRVTLVFGETGTFKTAVKQTICDAIAETGRYILDFTLEDSAELTAQRFLARHTGIPYGRIAARDLSATEMSLLAELQPAADAIAKRTIIVGNVPATVEEAIRLSRHWSRKVPLAAVCLDYVQLLETKNRDNEARQLQEIMKAVQRAAFRDKVAWIVLSQINRDFVKRPDRRPVLSDLYGGSAISQMVKLAIGIYRPWIYETVPDKDSAWHDWYVNAPNAEQKYKGALELWIRKCVNGESNVMVPTVIELGTGKFTKVEL